MPWHVSLQIIRDQFGHIAAGGNLQSPKSTVPTWIADGVGAGTCPRRVANRTSGSAVAETRHCQLADPYVTREAADRYNEAAGNGWEEARHAAPGV
jgi:hypothetical protein